MIKLGSGSILVPTKDLDLFQHSNGEAKCSLPSYCGEYQAIDPDREIETKSAAYSLNPRDKKQKCSVFLEPPGQKAFGRENCQFFEAH
jgi:hypothetical protein